MKRKTIIIVKNFYPVSEDPRLIKEISTIIGNRFRVVYIGWDNRGFSNVEKNTSQHSTQMLSTTFEERIFKFRVKFGGLSYIPILPIWWLFVLMNLISIDWDVAHAINLPSVPPLIFAKLIKKRPIIYEAEDTWIDQKVAPRWIRSIFISLERTLMKFFDAIIFVDELQIAEYGIYSSELIKKIFVIYDSAIDVFNKSFEPVPSKQFQDFVIFYAGRLTKSRKLNLEKLFTAVRDLNSVKVVVAGDGDLVEEILQWSRELGDRLKYIGRIPYEDVLKWTLKSDLLVVLRDPVVKVNKYICGSKVFEAMMCGKPIIVNKGTSTALKVIREKCGLVVDANDPAEIASAIKLLLEDKALYNTLCRNSRLAYETRYSWKLMAEKLIKIYENLTRRNDQA